MTHPVVTFNQNILSIDNGLVRKMFQLPSAIKQIEILDQVIAVRVHPEGVNFINENVFGISFEGKLLWQIEKVEHVDKDSPYTGLGRENDLLTAYNWDGFDYLVEPKTGKIIDRKFIK